MSNSLVNVCAFTMYLSMLRLLLLNKPASLCTAFCYRMQSIVSYQSEKERKGASRSSRVAVHSAKRPKVSK